MTLNERMEKLKDFHPEEEYLGEEVLKNHMHQFAVGKLVTMNLKMEEKGASEEEFENLTKAFMVIIKAGSIPMDWKRALKDFKIDELTFKYAIPFVSEQ